MIADLPRNWGRSTSSSYGLIGRGVESTSQAVSGSGLFLIGPSYCWKEHRSQDFLRIQAKEPKTVQGITNPIDQRLSRAGASLGLAPMARQPPPVEPIDHLDLVPELLLAKII